MFQFDQNSVLALPLCSFFGFLLRNPSSFSLLEEDKTLRRKEGLVILVDEHSDGLLLGIKLQVGMRIASVRGRTNKRLLYLMRVLFCKIHFSFICFCKPSCHLYTPSPLKLENTPPHQPPLPPEINSLASGQAFEAQSISISNGNASCNDHPSENGLKSSLRKASPESSLVEKKKVQWVDDVFGKQLVEIKEFEPSEDEDTADSQRVNERRCVCTFL